MTGFEDPLAMVAALPAFLVPLVVFASSMLEYVFPPYWGDTLVLVGFFLAGQGAVSMTAIFVAAVTGALVGAAVAYAIGRRYGLRALHRFGRGRRRTQAREKVRRLFKRHGEPILLLNRFLPVVRGVMLYAAGAMELRPRPVMLYSTLGSVIWVTFMMGIGWLTGGTWDQLQATFAQSSKVGGLLALAIFAGWLAWFGWRYARGPTDDNNKGVHNGDAARGDVDTNGPNGAKGDLDGPTGSR